MNETLIYLLKVSGGLGIIFLPYYLLFRNDPNLVLKRFYLLSGIISAWIFPLISFRRPELLVNITPTVFIDLNGAEDQAVRLAGANPGVTVNWIQLLVIAYLSGLIILFLINLITVIKWNLRWRKTKIDNGVAFTEYDHVFTLFSKIFVPGELRGEKDLDNVLLHEKAHIQQLHFIDLMIMEFTLLLTWFNPFSWLISRMIKENHEHLADRQVLSVGISPARYKAQLLNHTLGENVFRLGNQFNHSLTIKRFKMMKKPKRNPAGIVKIALMIPAVLVTMGLTTGMTKQQKTIKGKIILADTGEPAVGAAIVVRNGTLGATSDARGAFMLKVEENPELVVSFVGYSSLVVKSSEIGKEPLELVPTSYDIDISQLPDQEPDQGPKGKPKVDVLSPKEMSSLALSDKDVLEVDEQTFYIVEEMPSFPGGKAALKRYVYSKIQYPETAREKGLSGEVLVQFSVNPSGKLEDIKVAKSSDKVFEEAALAVFKDMPDWLPGSQRGKAVKVKVVISIPFNIEKV